MKPIFRNRRGAAAVEFALVLPFLVALLLGVVEIARRIEVSQIMTAAVRDGGRYATGGASDEFVKNHIRGFLRNAGLPAGASNSAEITMTPMYVSANNRPVHQVVLTIPSSAVAWVPINTSWMGPSTLRVESMWVRNE
jgi:Flp pilus assembly pilin Flp